MYRAPVSQFREVRRQQEPKGVSLRPQAHYDNWLVYSLPDGLWMLAYVLLMGAIWNFHVKKSLLVTLPLAVVAIGSELLQIPRWIPGTFDIVDLFCYLMAIWLQPLIYPKML